MIKFISLSVFLLKYNRILVLPLRIFYVIYLISKMEEGDMMQATTYIFGHKFPDTDSVCASISLSYLKNKYSDFKNEYINILIENDLPDNYLMR